jgi:hypothetical protein
VIWLSGVLFFMLRTAGNATYIYRLSRRDTQSLSPEWVEAAGKMAQALGIRRRVSIRVSARIRSPFVAGLIKPVVLLPLSSFSHLSYDQLEAVLAHELAHIRRWDDVVNWLQTAFEIILFYHPALWWMSQVIRDEREKCCDDLAVATCGNALVYAQALTQLESLPNKTSPLALALSRTGTGLLARIERLLQPNTVNNKPSAIPVTITMLLAATLVINLQVQFPSNLHTSSSAPVYTGAILGLQPPSASDHSTTSTDSPWQPHLPDWLGEEKVVSGLTFNDTDTVPPAVDEKKKFQKFYFRAPSPPVQVYYADSLLRYSFRLDSVLSARSLSTGVHIIKADSLNRISIGLDSLLARRAVPSSNVRIMSLDTFPKGITIHADSTFRTHVFSFPDIDVDVLENIDLDIDLDDLTDIEIILDSVNDWSNRFQFHFSDTIPPSFGSIPQAPMPPVMIFNDSVQEEAMRVYEEAMRNYEWAFSRLDSADWERQLEQQMAQLEEQQRRFEAQMKIQEKQYKRQLEQWELQMEAWEQRQQEQQQRYEERVREWEERQKEQIKRQQEQLKQQPEKQQRPPQEQSKKKQ